MTISHHVQSLVPALILAGWLSVTACIAQETGDLAARANEAVQASDWESAAALYSDLTQSEPDDAMAWYRLGQATMRSGGDTAAARAAFEQALQLGHPPATALFGMAKSYVRDGQPDSALETLERLVQQGPSRYVASLLQTDAAFESLAGNERFSAVVTGLTPCATPEYRQFDFWLGSWEVFSPQGQRVGTNVVTQSLDGCMLIENWESAAGGQKGMSINYYDSDTGKWSQIYRDNTGNISQWPTLVGGLVDGVMVLDSGPDTQPRTVWKWSRESDGRVRQMAESTTDGETWNTVWDSFYVPVSDPPGGG